MKCSAWVLSIVLLVGSLSAPVRSALADGAGATVIQRQNAGQPVGDKANATSVASGCYVGSSSGCRARGKRRLTPTPAQGMSPVHPALPEAATPPE